MPSLDPQEIVSLGEGVFQILSAGKKVRDWVGGNTDLWIVPEGLTQTGSFKDHGGTVAMSVAKAMGIKTIACASTGDTSAMAAAYAAAAGLKCVVVLPAGKVTNVQLAQPVAHGARIITIPGSFDDCMRVVRELCEAGRVFPINSINPTRIEGHQATVFLMAQFLQWQLPDVFVVPVGNGSNSSSIGKAIRLLKQLGLVADKECKIIGVQSDSANPLATSWESVQRLGRVDIEKWRSVYQPRKDLGETAATAARIGNPVSWAKVMREICASDGAVLTVTEAELLEATRTLGSSGFSGCPQTGTALAGLRQAIARGFVKPGATVSLVSTATSLKFPDVAMEFGGDLITSAGSCDTEDIASIMGI
ncbi:MAG: threonine synthase [Patescibacteria group bacterium]